MKKSEFEEKEFQRLSPGDGEVARAGFAEDPPIYDLTLRREEVKRRALAAERAGVVWDPEKPEVLWQVGDLRLLATGRWEWDEEYGSGRWVPYNHRHTWRGLTGALDELARRLLAEREHVTDGSPCWCNPARERPGTTEESETTPLAAWEAWLGYGAGRHPQYGQSFAFFLAGWKAKQDLGS